MKYIIILMFLMLSLYHAWGQKMEEITHRTITIHQVDSSIKANVLLEQKKIKPSNSIHYYWYYNNAIHINQGGYEGKLLDGVYQVTSKDGKLITRGNFKKGVKVGKWKKWNTKGQLLNVSNWVNGYQSGLSKTFEDGMLVATNAYAKGKLNGVSKRFKNDTLLEKNHYKKGLLHGKQIVYQNDTVANEVNYRLGKEISPKEKKAKTKKEKSPETNEGNVEEEVVPKEDKKQKGEFWKKHKKIKEEEINPSDKQEKVTQPTTQKKAKKKSTEVKEQKKEKPKKVKKKKADKKKDD